MTTFFAPEMMEGLIQAITGNYTCVQGGSLKKNTSQLVLKEVHHFAAYRIERHPLHHVLLHQAVPVQAMLPLRG